MTGAENAAQIASQQCDSACFHRHIRAGVKGGAKLGQCGGVKVGQLMTV
jgi:hypothetical protein